MKDLGNSGIKIPKNCSSCNLTCEIKLNNSDSQFSRDNLWLNEIPCVHRIHNTLPLDGAHGVQNSLGMTISLKLLDQKLEQLSNHVDESNKASNSNKKVLVTFDDGHKDVLETLPMLKKHPNIQPILFITGKQLRGDVQPYPLTALYTWCATHNKNPNDLKGELGFDRKFLKLQSEEHQRALLSKAGIDLNPLNEQMVNLTDLDILTKNNWLIGYHGSQHCDLRIHHPHKLKPFFIRDYKLLLERGYTPWFAWPEGRWNNSLVQMAKSVGFNVQFGLTGETGIDNDSTVINRDIWK